MPAYTLSHVHGNQGFLEVPITVTDLSAKALFDLLQSKAPTKHVDSLSLYKDESGEPTHVWVAYNNGYSIKLEFTKV